MTPGITVNDLVVYDSWMAPTSPLIVALAVQRQVVKKGVDS